MSDLISKQFEEIIVEHPEITDKEHKGKPYYSIKYVEDGEKYIGYGTYKIEVLSSYIRDYFIPSAEPKTPSNGSITCMNTENTHDRTMGDLISRQEAKDAIDMALDHIDHVPPWVYDKLLNALNEVPSAEKSQLSGEDATKDATSDLIRRQDAIDTVEFGITYAKAINKSTGEVKELFKEGNKALNEAVERLKELPSAEPDLLDDGTLMMTVPNGMLNDVKRVLVDEVGTKFCKVMYQDEPERKNGEWIDYTEDGFVECPFCHSATNCDGNKDELRFCFSCGAELR